MTEPNPIVLLLEEKNDVTLSKLLAWCVLMIIFIIFTMYIVSAINRSHDCSIKSDEFMYSARRW